MIKILGAILVFGGCSGFGFAMAAAYHREERLLEQLCRALEYMSCELSYRLTPLPQLCRNAANAVTGPARRVFERLAQELEQQVAPDAECCMSAVLASMESVPDSVENLLRQLGQTMGSFDLPGQLRGIEGCIQSARNTRQQLEQDRSSRVRSYQTLGLCAGAALAIIFL